MMGTLGKLGDAQFWERSGEIQNDATHEITKSKMAPEPAFSIYS